MYNVRYKTLFNEIKLHNNITSYSSLHIKVNKVSSKVYNSLLLIFIYNRMSFINYLINILWIINQVKKVQQ